MNNTFIRVVIIICCIAFSFLFYKNYTDVNKKIESQDIVLDLVNNHDRYHEIYMKQFDGEHDKEESLKIIKEVYLKGSDKIINPQIQVGNIVIKSEDNLANLEYMESYDNYKFSYNEDSDIIIVEGIQEMEENTNEE